eukprot:933844-Amorphochlora_amoeboformis.AAC.1
MMTLRIRHDSADGTVPSKLASRERGATDRAFNHVLIFRKVAVSVVCAHLAYVLICCGLRVCMPAKPGFFNKLSPQSHAGY